MGNFTAFLKRKEMGLPIWVWALIAAVALFFIMRYMRGRTPSEDSGMGLEMEGYAPGVGFPGSGGGSSGDFGSSGGSGYDDLSSRLDRITNNIDDLRYGRGFLGQGGVAKQSGATANMLQWGGTVFTDQASFYKWLNAHGGNLADLASKHPAAFSILNSLPQGNMASVKTPVKTSAASKSSNQQKPLQTAAKTGAKTPAPAKATAAAKKPAGKAAPAKPMQPKQQAKTQNKTKQPAKTAAKAVPKTNNPPKPKPTPKRAPAKPKK